MEIKSADEILKKHIGETMSQKGILDAMKEYAEQFINLAVEKVKTKTSKTMWQGMSDFVEITEVDKESILKIKQLIK